MRKVNMMVQRLVIVLLMMVVFVGCGDDESVEDLKDTDAKNIILGMALIPAGSFEMGDHFNVEEEPDTGDRAGC